MNGTGRKPEHYQIEDFATDESFINFVFKLNKEDESFWEQWQVMHPDQHEKMEAASDLLRSLSLTLSETEQAEELQRLTKALFPESAAPPGRTPAVSRFLDWPHEAVPTVRHKRKGLRYVLPLVLIVAMAGYFFVKNASTHGERLLVKSNTTNGPEVLTLSDGTVVTLATQGVFRYPENFGNQDRNVYLDGEAQFQVKRDEKHPFRVLAGDVTATVLGTVFNVKKQHGDAAVFVELIKGSLEVRATDSSTMLSQSIILKPDERVVYQGHGQKLYKEKWQPQNETLLEGGYLVFRQNDFDEIAVKLKAVYGISVVNQSMKKNWRFTGKFKNSSIKEVLESICVVEKLSYKVQGDTVIIK